MNTLYALDASAMRTAKDAVDTIGRFPQALMGVEKDIAKVNLRSDIALIVCYHLPSGSPVTVDEHRVYFQQPTSLLQPILKNISASNVEFLRDFKSFLGWLSQTFPATSEKFKDVTDKLEALSQNPGKDQRDAALASLSGLVTSLHEGSEKLKPYISASAKQQEKNDGYLKQFQNATTTLSDQLDNEQKELQKEVSIKYAASSCDRQRMMQDLEESFKNIRRRYTASVATLGTALDKLQAGTAEANRALAVISGTLINFSASYNEAITLLDRAQNSELGGIIQKFQVKISWNSWKEFADYAKEQLPPSLTSFYSGLVTDLFAA